MRNHRRSMENVFMYILADRYSYIPKPATVSQHERRVIDTILRDFSRVSQVPYIRLSTYEEYSSFADKIFYDGRSNEGRLLALVSYSLELADIEYTMTFEPATIWERAEWCSRYLREKKKTSNLMIFISLVALVGIAIYMLSR